MPKANILIVEDENIVAMDIKKSLESMGYHVCAMASSGEEAVQKAGETKPDLALMDIVLKGAMDGVEAAEQIGARFKVPIVYLTAYDDDAILQRAKITAPYAYITKPFNDRELHIAIEVALYKHQAEAQISKTERRLAAVLRSVGDAVIASDEERRITFMNPTAERLTGWKQEDACGKRLTEVLNIKNGELDNLEKHLVEKVMTEGLIINLLEDRLLIAKDGTEIPVSDSAAPIRDDDGETPGTVLVFRDIREQKRAEAELRESERHYRLLFEGSTHGILATDIETKRFMHANPSICRMLGYAEAELLQLGIADIHPQDAQDQLLLDIESRLHGGHPVSSSVPYLRKDGTVMYADIAETEADFQGRRCIVGFFTDVTERKRVEDALRKSEEIFRHFMEYSPIYIFFKDENIRAIRLSRNFEKMLGRPIDELLGKTMYDLFPSDLAKSMVADDLKILKEGKQINVEEELNGRLYSTVKFPIFLEGKPLYLAGFTIDITERKRMEEELLKADKLESVGLLAGGIAHDFNNILTSISGNISMAKMRLKPDDKIFDLLSSAENASVRAQGLTRQLLTFAKGGSPVKETASIQKLIRESSLFVVRGSKSECQFQIAEDLWPVEVDTGQISQVISNIVINANQAMPEGGIIRISAENMVTEKIHDMPVSPGKYIHISIKDNGVGIAEKHLSKVFDPFFTTKQTGSGLGLATTYSITTKHNGRIFVNSLLGKGTTFHIYLPASDKEIPVKEETVLLTGCGKILMMDDDEFLKELAKEMLDTLGYESEFAENGAEAIEMYKKARESGKPYDAVILDLTIPGSMGGEEVIKILLNIDPEVKAIVFSGYSEGEVMSNFRDYGFKGMMPKPFDSHALGKVLHNVLKDSKSVKKT
jgi:PAS domain S-box-containing protein